MKTVLALAVTLLLVKLAGVVPAVAQDRPPTIPTRDVDVTYRLGDGPQALTQRMRWEATQGLLRVDPPSPGLYMIVDYRTHHAAMVRQEDRKVIDLAGQVATLPGNAGGPGASFARRGRAQVAGLACTEWQTNDMAGDPTEVCFTADGVLLRARLQGNTILEATSVAYGAQDPAAFQLPAGYTHVKQPAGQAG